jgi:hypothetical protein
MSETEEQLTDDEIVFIEAYLHNGFNAGEAYKAISPTCTQSTANSQGSRFTKKLKETQYFRNKLHEIRNNYGLSMKKQIERLNAIYERSMEHKMKLEFDPTTKEMVQKVDENGDMVFEYDSRGALGAIKEQNEMLGFHKATAMKLELSGQGKDGAFELTVKREITN